MAIDFSFNIVTDLSVSDIQKQILSLERFELQNESIIGPGLVAFNVFAKSDTGKSIIKESLGFVPNLHVLFRIEKFDTTRAGYKSVLIVALEMLRQSTGDAALLIDSEIVVLIRRERRLVLLAIPGFGPICQPLMFFCPTKSMIARQ